MVVVVEWERKKRKMISLERDDDSGAGEIG